MSSYYKFYKAVPIDVYGKGEYFGPEWVLGIWEFTENRPQWGLMYFNQPTLMSYGLEYAKPQDAVEKLEHRKFVNGEEIANPDTDWYFDAGRKVTVKKDDLERAFKELDIWNWNDKDKCHWCMSGRIDCPRVGH